MKKTRNHIIMLKQASFHIHLLIVLITHHLINTLVNLLPSNTKPCGWKQTLSVFPLLFYCLMFYCPLPPNATCNLNQYASEPDRSSVSASWRMRAENADSTRLTGWPLAACGTSPNQPCYMPLIQMVNLSERDVTKGNEETWFRSRRKKNWL